MFARIVRTMGTQSVLGKSLQPTGFRVESSTVNAINAIKYVFLEGSSFDCQYSLLAAGFQTNIYFLVR